MSFVVLWFCKDGGLRREFTYGSLDLDLEGIYKFLTKLVTRGWTLLFVEFQDKDGSCIELPVSAFDGKPMDEHLQSLQTEWETILQQHFR